MPKREKRESQTHTFPCTPEDSAQFDLQKQFVIVAGFNELSGSGSLAPLLKLAGLRNVFEQLPNDADRWTHRDDARPSKNDQIDYLLVSERALAALTGVGIERAKYPPPATVTGDSNSASDHAAVWADFDL